jgi:hypothetical protein
MRHFSIRRRGVLALSAVCLALCGGCSITSPYWDYVPASITTPIPFQAWTLSTAAHYVECANDTTGHGSPSAGEASYINAATLWPSSQPSLDSVGAAIYSASKQVTLPSACWKYFGDYDFWQANVRVVQLGADGKKQPLRSYDLDGLECLGRENGKVARWNGHLNKGCEKTYLGSSTVIPYIVLRIEGYQNGIEASASAPVSKRSKPLPALRQSDSLPVMQVELPSAAQVQRLNVVEPAR